MSSVCRDKDLILTQPIKTLHTAVVSAWTLLVKQATKQTFSRKNLHYQRQPTLTALYPLLSLQVSHHSIQILVGSSLFTIQLAAQDMYSTNCLSLPTAQHQHSGSRPPAVNQTQTPTRSSSSRQKGAFPPKRMCCVVVGRPSESDHSITNNSGSLSVLLFRSVGKLFTHC